MNTNIVFLHSNAKPYKQLQLHSSFSFYVNEIKNPLCNIYLACDILSQTDLNEEQKICLGIIMRGSARINNLVSTTLSFPPTGEAVNRPYTFRQLLEEVLIRVKDQIQIKQIKITEDYTAMDNVIWLDTHEMSTSLTTIIGNVIDAIPSGAELKFFLRSADKTSTIEIQYREKDIVT